ncbi:response regulator transcription factor [Nitrosococcus wardiae]|uniref:Response regulator transcription factor n=1 Tax=Nitrosococcus wardiae TaxID=1814290 RepID=A0A4P7C186_9GAMM|nr:LuxR C-terminal-related transcriptional regulator [Nitrosococcus wardiae]QBQ55340.1 response regulator transcription factor [Nitrosococcus wardiae]
MSGSYLKPIPGLTPYRQGFADAPDAASPPVTIFIVSGDRGMHQTLRQISESTGAPCSAYTTAEAFLADFDPTLPACLLLDIHAPHMGGLMLQQQLQHRGSRIPLLFVSAEATVPEAVQAIQAGAMDFIIQPLKGAGLVKTRLKTCLAQARQNQIERQKEAEIAARLARLTPREQQIIEGVVAGKQNKQMAFEWNISIKTVQIHRARVMKKLQVRNRAELINLVLSLRKRTQEVARRRGGRASLE